MEKITKAKKHRKGLWSPEEDDKLRSYIIRHGHGCWSSVPINAGLQRNGKSCRLRWINYLRPGLKRGTFSAQEEEAILNLHHVLGNKWSQIAQHLSGRTDNEIKNFWHSYLKKKVANAKETKSSSKTQFTNSSSQEHVQSPAKSINNTVSSSDPFGKGSESRFSSNSKQPSSANSSENFVPPKILFTEWLTILGNTNNFTNNLILNNENTAYQHNQFPCYNNSKSTDFSQNLDVQEGYNQGVMYKNNYEGSSSSSEEFYTTGVSNRGTFDSLLKFEDQTPETEFANFVLFSEDDEIIPNDFLMANNLLYI